MPIHEDRLRAQLVGGAQRHGGMHTELARFIRRSCHYAAFVGPPADHDRLAAQRWIKQLLYRYEERVHINVEDDVLVRGSAILG